MYFVEKEKIVVFGAGYVGCMLTKLLSYDKEIVFIVDNDSKKQGQSIGVIPIISPSELITRRKCFSRVVIAVENVSQVVFQLKSYGIREYVYYSDLYGDSFYCDSKLILDRNVTKTNKGAYTSKQIKQFWMNHLNFAYTSPEYVACTPTEGAILDVGAGCGTSLFQWLLRGYRAVGIDCCKWKLDFCWQKVEDFGFPTSWKDSFKFGYAESLPFEDNSFDIVTCLQVLEHVKDWRKTIDEMVRCVKKGGSIFLKAPDYDSSYDDHYGIDIGVPIAKNVEAFKQAIILENACLDEFDGLNFVTKHDVMDYLAKKKLELIDLEPKYPFVFKRNGNYLYSSQINLIIKKLT